MHIDTNINNIRCIYKIIDVVLALHLKTIYPSHQNISIEVKALMLEMK